MLAAIRAFVGGKAKLLVGIAIAAAVYGWQAWTIDGLEADVQEQANRADIAERNVREYATAIEARNDKIDAARERAETAEAEAQSGAVSVLDVGRENRAAIRADSAETTEELNQWLDDRLSR